MKNTGATTWTAASQYRLGAKYDAPDADGFPSAIRTDVPSDTPPGGTATFNFTLTAPSTPGTYILCRQMVQELIEWFGAYTPATNITVNAPDIGLRAYDGTGVVRIAAEPTGTVTSPLRIRKGNTTYGIPLVDRTDPSASKIIINTSLGPKALKKDAP